MSTEMLIKQFEESLKAVKETCVQLEKQLDNLKNEVNAQENTKSVYVPEEGDSYAFVDDDGTVNYTVNTDGMSDARMVSYGNVFPETDDITDHLSKYSHSVLRVQDKLMQLHELLCPDYFPDWQSVAQQKYVIYYNGDAGWTYTFWADVNYGVVCFTHGAAREACDILNREDFRP